MAFINDYLTEEEKARFEVYDIKYPNNNDNAGNIIGVGKGKISCTVDRERNMYLFQSENSLERREGIKYIEYFSLVKIDNDKTSVIHFELKKESGMADVDKKYDLLWKYGGIDTTYAGNYSTTVWIKYLKEALQAYGSCGSIRNLNYIVEFDF